MMVAENVVQRGQWIEFVDEGVPRGMKTHVFAVRVSGSRDEYLGSVKWFPRWRRYAFFPLPQTAFEATCLGEIAKFVSEQTRARKEERRQERAAQFSDDGGYGINHPNAVMSAHAPSWCK